MTGFLGKLTRLAELARVELVAAVAANVWLMTWLAFTVEPASRRNPAIQALGLPLSLVLGGLVAAGLAACAVGLNDVLDRRHDRAFSPSKPSPSRQVDITTAVVVAVVGVLVALAAAAPLGTVSIIVAVLAAGGILFYNLTGRFVPSAGILAAGLIHAASMSIINPNAALLWPVLLVMTHVVICGTIHHHLAGKRPRFRRVDTWTICVGWSFWAMLLIGLMSHRIARPDTARAIEQAGPWIWLGPALAVTGFVAVAAKPLLSPASPGAARRRQARRFQLLSAAWLPIYALAWLASAGLVVGLLLMLGLLAVTAGLLRLQQVAGDAATAPGGYRVRTAGRAASPRDTGQD